MQRFTHTYARTHARTHIHARARARFYKKPHPILSPPPPPPPPHRPIASYLMHQFGGKRLKPATGVFLILWITIFRDKASQPVISLQRPVSLQAYLVGSGGGVEQ